MPNDPFKRPAPTPAPAAPKSNATAAAAAEASNAAVSAAAADAADTPSGATLALETTSERVMPGEVSVVNLTGISGLAPLTTLELTVEWDPYVAEVTGIAPGAWRNSEDAASIRFDADRTAGRAHLHFARAGQGGLPDGVLAKLAVKGTAPGTTLVRVTAGAAATSRGPAAPPVVDAASFTVKAVP
jgi:hypothetical protein